MADQLLDQARELFEGTIDFEGQRLCDTIVATLLYFFGALAFIAGYFLQDIRLCLYIILGGTAVTALVAIPPWPMFKKNPVKWLSHGSINATTQPTIPQTVVVDEKVLG